MQFALDRLDDLITVELANSSPAMRGLKSEMIIDYTEKVRVEILEIRTYLWARFEKVINTEQIHMLAKQYQSSLSALLEQVQESRQNTAINEENLRALYDNVENQIDKMLSIIERHFIIWIRPIQAKADFFLHTMLNQQEITAVFYALVDVGIIDNHTYDSLFDFIAPLIATKSKKGLTARSMIKSKIKLSPDMKWKLKDLYLKMSKEMDKY